MYSSYEDRMNQLLLLTLHHHAQDKGTNLIAQGAILHLPISLSHAHNMIEWILPKYINLYQQPV